MADGTPHAVLLDDPGAAVRHGFDRIGVDSILQREISPTEQAVLLFAHQQLMHRSSVNFASRIARQLLGSGVELSDQAIGVYAEDALCHMINEQLNPLVGLF